MKKLIYIYLISLFVILPSKAFAFTGSLELECDNLTKKVGETISCTLYGKSDSGVSAVEATLVYDGYTIKNAVVPSIWEGDYENKSLLLYTDTNKTTKFELLKFDVTSSEAGEKNLTFNNVYFSDASFARNQILNPNYTFTFISEEESQQNEENTSATIVDEDTSSANKSETESNVDTGTFMPIALILVLSTLSVIIFTKVKGKKIYKL
ncbi:MAG: hypothetical protein IKX00_05065 [Bacilli bacterium]|nr:hypothetical protein [Bacilli bacterium]